MQGGLARRYPGRHVCLELVPGLARPPRGGRGRHRWVPGHGRAGSRTARIAASRGPRARVDGGIPPARAHRPPGLVLPDASPAPPHPHHAGPGTCATDVHRAEKVPLDLLLLVDTSDSMNQLSGMQSKWQLTRQALRSFVEDPGSQGLGVGLLFFPAATPPGQIACQQDAECAAISGTGPRPCRKSGWCFAAGLPLLTNRPCAPGLSARSTARRACNAGPRAAVPAGRCVPKVRRARAAAPARSRPAAAPSPAAAAPDRNTTS